MLLRSLLDRSWCRSFLNWLRCSLRSSFLWLVSSGLRSGILSRSRNNMRSAKVSRGGIVWVRSISIRSGVEGRSLNHGRSTPSGLSSNVAHWHSSSCGSGFDWSVIVLNSIIGVIRSGVVRITGVGGWFGVGVVSISEVCVFLRMHGKEECENQKNDLHVDFKLLIEFLFDSFKYYS